MRRTPAAVTGFVLCAILGLLDVLGVLGAGTEQAPPLPIIIVGAVLGVVTLTAALPAWRGNRTALRWFVASRALSIPLGIPAYFTDEVTTGTLVGVTAALAAGVVAIALLLPALRGDRAVARS